MNQFRMILDWANKIDDNVINKIVNKINLCIVEYDAVSKIFSSNNNQPDSIDNKMIGYDRGLKGDDGYNPIMIKSQMDMYDPYRRKQDILIRITGLFEILEEIYFERKGK